MLVNLCWWAYSPVRIDARLGAQRLDGTYPRRNVSLRKEACGISTLLRPRKKAAKAVRPTASKAQPALSRIPRRLAIGAAHPVKAECPVVGAVELKAHRSLLAVEQKRRQHDLI